MIKSIKNAMITFIVMTIVCAFAFLISISSMGTFANINNDTSQQNKYKTTDTDVESVIPDVSIAKKSVTVDRVIDGDTFTYYSVWGERDTVRLIGVDTPESVNADKSKNCPYGKTASTYTTKILEGKKVFLEYDEDETDKYGRKLCYVYLGDVCINYDLVVKGYAVAKEYPPNTKYADTFKSAQIEAEKNKSGLWADDVSDEVCNLKSSYYINY